MAINQNNMESMLFVISVIFVLQLIALIFIVVLFRKIRFLIELELECMRFDVINLRLAVLNNSVEKKMKSPSSIF